MLSIAGSLALKLTPPRKRTAVTPGHLFRMLSAEFRAQRPPGCMCRMGMVAFRDGGSAVTANWTLERASRSCPRCEPVMSRLVAHFAELYDIRHHPGGESK